jgi:AraC-like DNA-binding protein
MPVPSPNATRHPDYRAAAIRLLRGMLARGIDPAPLLDDLRISPDLLTDPTTKVRGQQIIRLMSSVRQVLGDEFLGLTPHRSKPGSMTLMIELALHCDTLGAALEQMLRTDRLLTDDRQITLTLRDDDAELQFVRTHPECDPEHFLIESWLLHWHRMLSWMTGYLLPIKRVDLSIDEPPSPDRLCYHIDNDWNPGQPVDALVFSRRYLTLPIVRTRAEWQEHLLQGLRGTPVWPEGETQWSTRVKKLLIDTLNQRHACPELDAVAAALHTTSQTLRRHLRDEGTGFQSLLDAVRRDLAIEKMHVQHLSVGDVATQLGFAEPRSFSRAFKQWTGVSPSAYLSRHVPARRPR